MDRRPLVGGVRTGQVTTVWGNNYMDCAHRIRNILAQVTIGGGGDQVPSLVPSL